MTTPVMQNIVFSDVSVHFMSVILFHYGPVELNVLGSRSIFNFQFSMGRKDLIVLKRSTRGRIDREVNFVLILSEKLKIRCIKNGFDLLSAELCFRFPKDTELKKV